MFMLSAVTRHWMPRRTRAKYLKATSSYGFKPKANSAFKPSSVNFPFIHPQWSPPPPHHTPLSLCFHSKTLRAAQQAEIFRRPKTGPSFSIKLLRKPALVAVANHKRVQCHLLVHNLSSLAFLSPMPPHTFSPSFPLSSLLPPTDTLADATHSLTHHMFPHTHREYRNLWA